MSINIAGPLQPTTVNTPLDARTRIDTLDGAADISLPYLGMIFYCAGTGRHYKVTGLKSKTAGPFTTENALVDTYEVLPETADLATLAANIAMALPPERIVFEISGLASSDLAALVIEFDSDPAFPADSETMEKYDSGVTADNAKFLAWGGVNLSGYPAAGINAAFNGGCVIFLVPDTARAKNFYRFYWRSESGDSQGSVSSAQFGCLRSVTHRAALDTLGFGEEASV